MNAQCVAAVRTALVKQCAEDRDRIVCHYSADGFKYLLRRLNLWDRHPLLVHHLRHGFPMARNPDIPPLSTTFLPNNHLSASDTPEHRNFVIDYLATEERAGHISPPYPEDVIRECYGHICSSPLGVVEKSTPPGEPQKYRLITNASYPDQHGVTTNSFIDSDQFPTMWHGPEEIAHTVRTTFVAYSSLARRQLGLSSYTLYQMNVLVARCFTLDAGATLVVYPELRPACVSHNSPTAYRAPPPLYLYWAARFTAVLLLISIWCWFQILTAPQGTRFAVGDISACFHNNPWRIQDKCFAAI